MLINGVGATATGITLIVILCAKFLEGAWITMLLMPLLLLTMTAIRRHYGVVAKAVEAPLEFDPGKPKSADCVAAGSELESDCRPGPALRLNLSAEVRAVHIECRRARPGQAVASAGGAAGARIGAAGAGTGWCWRRRIERP